MADTQYIYADALDAVAAAAGGSDKIWTEAEGLKLSTDEFYDYLEQSGWTVVRTAEGGVLNVFKPYTVNTGISAGTSAAEAINSNVQTGTASAANTTNINGTGSATLDSDTGKVVTTTLSKYKTGELVTDSSFIGVLGSIGRGIMAAAAGIQLGKGIDNTIYKLGNALGLNPPSELDPSTWSTITAGIDENDPEYVQKAAGLFNTILGIDTSTNQLTAYADQNTFAYFARYLVDNGYIDISEKTYNDFIYDGTTYSPVNPIVAYNADFTFTSGTYTETYTITNNTSDVYLFPTNSGTDGYLVFASKGSFSITRVASNGSTTTRNVTTNDSNDDYPIYSTNMNAWSYAEILNNGLTLNGIQTNAPSFLKNLNIYAPFYYFYGTYTEKSNIDGITTLDGATVPDIDSGLSQEEMLAKLQELYPELWNERVEQNVLQDDGTTVKHVYIPISIPTGGLGSDVDSQNNTQGETAIDTSTATDTQLATLIQLLTNLANYPYGMIDSDELPQTNPLNPSDNPNPTDTGGGDTPVIPTITGQASSLYAIYNPTLAQINSFGAWLWSSDFIDQILKLFSDPMQAIIGLHKIYATPSTGDEQNIKVGYLDSGVSSKVVTDQYTTIDCGSVKLSEYFGNVFDYAPYTDIQLYLPFIGIVSLNVGDVMRSTIQITYKVDVLSGACLALVSVTRDSAGGVLYQYAGNAAVTMPISSGSYIGVIANVVGVASSVVGGFASGGALGAVAGGVSGVLSRRGGTQVQHSGNFSGNAGAMGIKTPYLIIERPQSALAENYADYIGNPSNNTVTLSNCSGYISVKEVHLEKISATGDEKTEIENLLKGGVLI